MSGILASIIPSPLHPAVVHLPMALAVLVPIFALVALVTMRRAASTWRTWAVAVAMFASLSLSAWASMETGEDESEKVEKVVPEAAVETHEEAAEQFLWFSVGVLAVAAAGLLKGGVGGSARLLATAGSVGILVMGYRVGHSGGALVYTHGAASAYTSAGALGTIPTSKSGDGDDR